MGASALVLYGTRVAIDLFGPELGYSMGQVPGGQVDSEEFFRFLSLVTGAEVQCSRLQQLVNGNTFFPAQLEAIRAAKYTIDLEEYEFIKGRVGEEFVEAMAERARAGVKVRLTVDALGSFNTPRSYFGKLLEAGGQMRWYHPLRWNTWPQLNNRTHRKLMIVDGRVGFIGGAGIADHWLYSTPKAPQWRDTMFRVEGEAVAGLVSVFSENWLESSGEILSGPHQFEFKEMPEGAESLVVSSTPSGGGTHARILFQALIHSARKSIRITTPYFLPDRSARRALMHAVQKRGVQVQILTAGPRIDHPVVRRITHHNSRHLLKAGAEMYEYQPAMIHAKLMTVDGVWSVMGSTNFDHRSFALNDEVNLAMADRTLAGEIDAQYERDLAQSRRLTLEMLRERTVTGKMVERMGAVLERED
jgi:cardiolipin synthase